MTQPDIEIDTAELRRHARMVEEVATMCDEAASAARYIDLEDQVYGEWCGPFFVPLINPAQDWALREIRSGVDATNHLAELLRTVSNDADTTDSAAAHHFEADR